MADALISPAVGGTMWAAVAGFIGYSCKQIKKEADSKKIPLMGVLAAFIFAAQMINFSIPGTGSSGHLGGGMILAILLGPYAGFLAMASVLIVQALFFGDGGLLALGCNIFNLGFFPCFILYPLIYKKITSYNITQGKIVLASMISAIVGLQLGAFGVVLETLFSGISELPFRTFVLLMQPIHLAIGIVEGLVTSAVVIFVWKARPEILTSVRKAVPMGGINAKKVLIGLVVVAAFTGGILSWFASSNPDGLEWAMFKTSGKEELESHNSIHKSLSNIQEKTVLLPDYGFKENEPVVEARMESVQQSGESWPAVSVGTSVSGLVGGLLTLLVAVLVGLILRRRTVTA